MTQPIPIDEELEDVLLSCRYGEVEEIREFGEKYGWEAIANARDQRGNTAIHMCCGNGHVGRSRHYVKLTCRCTEAAATSCPGQDAGGVE